MVKLEKLETVVHLLYTTSILLVFTVGAGEEDVETGSMKWTDAFSS